MFDFFENIKEAISVNRIYPHFLKIMGARYAIKFGNIDTLNGFKDMIQALSKEEGKIKQLKNNESKIFFNLMKAKIALFFNREEDAISYVTEAKKYLFSHTINNKEKNLMDSEDTLLYLKDLIEIEIQNINWINKLENKLLLIDNVIFDNELKIKNIIESYPSMEVNSEDHLLKSKEHLDLVVQNTLLLSEKRIEKYEDLHSEGKLILSKITSMKSKLQSLEYIVLSNGQPVLSRDNLDNYLIYRKLIVEEIKLKFYLDFSKEDLFKDISSFIKSEILFNTEKPLDILFNDFIPLEIKKESAYHNHNNFYNFLKTLKISFNKKDKLLNVQLLSEPIENPKDRILIT